MVGIPQISYIFHMRTSTLLSIGFKKPLQQSSALAVILEDFLFNLNLYSLNMAALDDPVLPVPELKIEDRPSLGYKLLENSLQINANILSYLEEPWQLSTTTTTRI
jgi:hypothetical protein